MSKYTVTIKNLLDNNYNLGLIDYPIFNESYRQTLNNNILNFYYNREIAFETAELFKFHLNARMNLIMPKYNELYNAYIKAKEKLFDNVNLKEELTRKNSSNIENSGKANSTSSSLNTSNSTNIMQDTPQGKIYNDEIENINWATEANINKSTNNNSISDESITSSTSSGNAIEEYIKTITGNDGKNFNINLLDDIKNNFQNIDFLIINELEDLFFGLL